jgi:4-cresol dehydrogenase (hydroxylating)
MDSKPGVLPPNVTAAAFSAAIAKFRTILGEDNVLVTPERVAPYAKIFVPDADALHLPSAALMPISVEQIQQIMGVCNEYKVPIWPVSTGHNIGYGEAAPAKPGTLVLDLKRMNRIIDIDADLCTALVEPGVTYQQMLDHIEAHNLPLWVDLPTIGPIVGPVGNTLDRGVGYTPYGDHFLMSCGMEVVLASGEILRTGMGSLKNSNTWQVFKWGYGPYLDGLFTQSNFGVVTKLGLWLMPRPPVYKPFMVRFPNVEDVDRIIDVIRPLRIAQLIPNVILMMNGLYEVAMFKRRHEVWDGPGSCSDAAMLKAAKELGLGAWNAYYALYGTEEIVAATEKLVTPAFQSIGGEVLTKETAGDNLLFRHHERLMAGQMTLEELGLARYRGAGGGLTWFAPVAQAKGSESRRQYAMARQTLDKYGFDYTAGFAIGWRELHHIIAVLYDRSDPAELAAAHACFGDMVTQFGDAGYGTYRTSTAFMDRVASTFGEVNNAVNRRLKQALDPNGILAPGKSGIYV